MKAIERIQEHQSKLGITHEAAAYLERKNATFKKEKRDYILKCREECKGFRGHSRFEKVLSFIKSQKTYADFNFIRQNYVAQNAYHSFSALCRLLAEDAASDHAHNFCKKMRKIKRLEDAIDMATEHLSEGYWLSI